MWHIESGRAVWAVESPPTESVSPVSSFASSDAGAADSADKPPCDFAAVFTAGLDLRSPAAGLRICIGDQGVRPGPAAVVEIRDSNESAAALNNDAAEKTGDAAPWIGNEHGLPLVSAFGWIEAPVRPGATGQISESYQRGTDLILTFAPTDDEVRTQLYYRILTVPGEDRFGVEWIVSLQTERLDSRPRFVSTTRVTVGGPIEPMGQPPHAWIALLAGTRYSVVELLAPVDVAALDLDDPGRSRIEWRVERLEKGVIRRARARLFVVPTVGAAEFARTALRDLLAAPPPLTT